MDGVDLKRDLSILGVNYLWPVHLGVISYLLIYRRLIRKIIQGIYKFGDEIGFNSVGKFC